jgi:chemotaxis protein MotB
MHTEESGGTSGRQRALESDFYKRGQKRPRHDDVDDDDFGAEAPRTSKNAWLMVVLLLAAGGAGLYYFRDKLETANETNAEAEKNASLLKDELDKAKKSNVELRSKIDQLEKDNTDLQSTQQQLATEVKDKDQELSRLKSTYDALQDKMQKEIGAGDIKLTQGGGRLQVDFIDKILFDSGDATISKRGEEVLGRVGAVLATVHDRQIQVSGHTDNARISEKLQDKYPTNWELSAARAINVLRFLQEKAGVPEKQLAVGAYGPHHPVASNATPQGRARNRRIEIVLLPTLQPIKKAEIEQAKAKPKSVK